MSMSSSSGVSFPTYAPTALGSASQQAHENVPLFVQKGTEQIPITQNKALIYQIGDGTGNPLRVDVSYTNGRIVIAPDTSKPYVYAPKNLSTLDTSRLVGDVQLGGFPICKDIKTGKLLFIQKVNGEFWFIPGGLVEKKDRTVWDVAIREVLEETGVTISGGGSLSYFYNSITQGRTPRQNLMAIFMNSGSYDTSDPVVPEEAKKEILAARWWDPAEFWAMFMKNPKFSLPSIEYCFIHLLAAEQKDLSIDWQKYQAFKDTLTSGRDDKYKILFDLSFLRCDLSGAVTLQTAMVEAKQKADTLLQ